MRSLWRGSISFGLINIPIELYSASSEKGINMEMLRKGDQCPIHIKRVCGDTNEEVKNEDIVRGYKLENGEYVVLEKEDMEALETLQTHTIDITSFIKSEEIDTVYFDKPYYLQPTAGGEKAYTLLLNALKKSGRIALASMVMRTKEHIGILKSVNNAIIFNQMRYPDELVPEETLDMPLEVEVTEKETELALRLVEQLTEPFKPEVLKDNYREKLEKFIKAKADNHKVTKAIEPTPTHVDELLAQLQYSLDHLSKHVHAVN